MGPFRYDKTADSGPCGSTEERKKVAYLLYRARRKGHRPGGRAARDYCERIACFSITMHYSDIWSYAYNIASSYLGDPRHRKYQGVGLVD